MNDTDETGADEQDIWRFSAWDALGAVFYGIEAAAGALKKECVAMANWQRNRFDADEAESVRRGMAEDLRRIVEGAPR